MENLFREIFVAPSPSLPSTTLPLVGDDISILSEAPPPPASASTATKVSSNYDDETSFSLDGIMARRDVDGDESNVKVNLNWASKDIQRLLDMLPVVAAEEGLCGQDSIWDITTAESAAVGVF